MRQTRKLTVTVQLELDQLERLTALARREGTNRSVIVRSALDREFARYERSQKKGDVPALDLERGTPTASVPAVARP